MHKLPDGLAMRLIRPHKDRTNNYREYDAETLQRIHRIRLLQAIGFTLDDIATLLDGAGDWERALALQEDWLDRRLDDVRAAVARVRKARAAIAAGEALGTEDVLRLIADADPGEGEKAMQDLLKNHYSKEALGKLARHPATRDEIEAGQQAWTEVLTEAGRLRDGDPSSPEAQALLARWDGLISAFTMDDPKVETGLKSLWADHGNWPEELNQKQPPIDPGVWAFIEAARKIANEKKNG